MLKTSWPQPYGAARRGQEPAGRYEGDGDTLPEQFATALGNLLTALRAAGGSPADLARGTVYATDVADHRAHAAGLGRIWRRLAGRDYPAVAVIGAARLCDEQALVEIDGMAVLP